jgi:hypothetical protein
MAQGEAKMTTLKDLLGPRGGIRAAEKAIRERGGKERHSYLQAHARS